jgi:hypothetical protein
MPPKRKQEQMVHQKDFQGLEMVVWRIFFQVWHHPYKLVREKPKAVPKTDFRVVPGGQ